mgnify:CR=1 FL=1
MALQLASLAIPVPTVRARALKLPVQLATTAMVMFKHPVLPAPTWQQQSLSPLMSYILPVPKDQDATAQTKRKTVILVFTALQEVKQRDQTTFPLKKEACVYLATTATQEASNKPHAVTAITAPTMPLKPKLAHAGQAFTALKLGFSGSKHVPRWQLLHWQWPTAAMSNWHLQYVNRCRK